MKVHTTFTSMLGKVISGFIYLQHELSEHIDIDKLEKIMQRVMLKHNEFNTQDRRGFSPLFIFSEVEIGDGAYLRLNMYRPDGEEMPGELYAHMDFIEHYEAGLRYPSLKLVANPWAMVKKQAHSNLTFKDLRTQIRLLADYLDPIEYFALNATVASYARIISGHAKDFKFDLLLDQRNVMITVLRKNDIFTTHQLYVLRNQ